MAGPRAKQDLPRDKPTLCRLLWERVPDHTAATAMILVCCNPSVFLPATAEPDAKTITQAAAALEQRLHECWNAWQQHPAFSESASHEPHNPEVIAVYQHPPGVAGATRSYLIGPVREVSSPMQQRWAQRAWDGCFADLVPVRSTTPVSPHRIGAFSNSVKGAGNAWRARTLLKQLLPARFHHLISSARKTNCSGRKLDRLKEAWLRGEISEEEWHAILADPRDTSLQPDWYRRTSRRQLWIDRLNPHERADLAVFINPEAFWKAATGRIPYQEVPNHIHQRQLQLFPDPPLDKDLTVPW